MHGGSQTVKTQPQKSCNLEPVELVWVNASIKINIDKVAWLLLGCDNLVYIDQCGKLNQQPCHNHVNGKLVLTAGYLPLVRCHNHTVLQTPYSTIMQDRLHAKFGGQETSTRLQSVYWTWLWHRNRTLSIQAIKAQGKCMWSLDLATWIIRQ